MSRFDLLPDELKRYIYEFDPTYRMIFSKKVVPKLGKCPNCSRIKKPRRWNKKVVKDLNDICDELGEMRLDEGILDRYCVRCIKNRFDARLDELSNEYDSFELDQLKMISFFNP